MIVRNYGLSVDRCSTRPRNTYYRGLYTDGDMQPSELPMQPEISVISTVRLYFESPAAKRANQAKENEKGKD